MVSIHPNETPLDTGLHGKLLVAVLAHMSGDGSKGLVGGQSGGSIWW